MQMATRHVQTALFSLDPPVSLLTSSTFVPNMGSPVHRWFRYSAGFAAEWVGSVIRAARSPVRIFDPFAGSGTTLLAAEAAGVESWGLEAHPFIYRVARAKLLWRSDPEAYLRKIEQLNLVARGIAADLDGYPTLIRRCYGDHALGQLDALRRAFEVVRDESPASELAWLTLIGILRKV